MKKIQEADTETADPWKQEKIEIEKNRNWKIEIELILARLLRFTSIESRTDIPVFSSIKTNAPVFAVQ